jgi:protoporphyrinogen oxidase
VVRDGFRFDLGGHRFFTKNRSVFEFVAGLLGDDLLSVPRLSRIHFRGRFVDYPIRPLNALLNVGPVTTLRVLKDLLLISLRKQRGPAASLEEWMTASFGTTLYETYFKVYAEKVWGMRADRIHADLAAQRVKGLGLADTIRNAVFRRSARARESMVERFHYPRLGYGQICDRMAAELTEERVALQSEPVRVAHDGKRIVAVDVAGPGGATRAARPEHVISSIPITTLVRLFDPPPPEPVRRAADGLGFRAVVFAAVFVDLPSVRPESWIYFPAPEVSFGRTTEPRNWSAAMAPAGKTSLVAEHFCDAGDATWRASDEEIVRRTVADFVRLRLFGASRVLGSCVVRAARAYPRMDVGHKERLAVIESWLDGFGNLQVVGRSGMFRYHNTDHVIEAGLGAAANVLGGTVDLRAVNSELTYHESRRSA